MSCSPLHTGMTATETARRRQAHRQLWAASPSGNNALDISYAYDVRGQLLEERRNGASVCYAYDKAGNRIRKTDVQGEIRYLYNEKNQLVEEESPADRKQFSYDRQGGIIEEKNACRDPPVLL